MEYEFPLDTTKFVEASIHEVYKTLIEAGVLVLIVILVFLQDWRAVLVPATTVPVTIIGAFFAMALMGYTVNMLTLFGLVLAIGIVVDDAIVVVENAAHHIEQGMAPKPATIQAMDEVLGPIIGITLVLMSVFLPSAFLGRHHRAAVPAVRADDRRDGADQRDQRGDAQAGPVRPVAAAAQRAEELFRPRVQPRLRLVRSGCTRPSCGFWCATWRW